MGLPTDKITEDKIEYSYDSKTGFYTVTGFERGLDEAEIPAAINGTPVHVIDKKAFLGCKSLLKITLKGDDLLIKEWAFAHCDNLSHVIVEGDSVKFEKGIFTGDEKLTYLKVFDSQNAQNVITKEKQSEAEDAAYLMAAAPVVMEAEYLLDTFGSNIDEWLVKWDMKLRDILARKDEEGYHLYVLCGEEDLHFDYDEYIEYKREKKAGLCMLRLLHDYGLDNNLRAKLTEYLRNCSKGCENEAGFKYLIKNHPDEIEYYELLVKLECINGNNVEAVLAELGERHAQMKAYLIKELTKSEAGDFYDDLMI